MKKSMGNRSLAVRHCTGHQDGAELTEKYSYTLATVLNQTINIQYIQHIHKLQIYRLTTMQCAKQHSHIQAGDP